MSAKRLLIRHEKSGGEWLCEYDVGIISGAFFRMKGLLGRDALSPHSAIWLNPCASIHMFFMKFPIDAVFLDKENRIVAIYHSIKPWRATRIVSHAKSCVEMPAGEAASAGLVVGDSLHFSNHSVI